MDILRKSKNIFLASIIIIPSMVLSMKYNDGKLNENSSKNQKCHENPLKRQMFYLPQRERYSKSSNVMPKTTPKKILNIQRKTCIFCKLLQEDNDRKNLLITRFKYNSVWLALYPYNKGHLLIIPNKHIKDLDDLEMPDKIELMQLISKVNKILKNSLGAKGANIGINIGKISGASKPDHIHVHVIPRYPPQHPSNITQSFIHLIGETKVTQWDLTKLYDKLKPKFDELKEFMALPYD